MCCLSTVEQLRLTCEQCLFPPAPSQSLEYDTPLSSLHEGWVTIPLSHMWMPVMYLTAVDCTGWLWQLVRTRDMVQLLHGKLDASRHLLLLLMFCKQWLGPGAVQQ